uniref:G-protein coupled receptors family 1 profile domain-containing protein n=1 Tax=Globodera rostochiensis TaxID=31243 RepID=A0A914HLA7_GLORO
MLTDNNKSISSNISIEYLINNISNSSSALPTLNESDHFLKLNLNPFSLMNILISTPLLVLQLMTLPIFLIHSNYRNNVCFRILFTNGVTDCLQLAPMLMFAVLNLITDQIPIWMQMICGSIVINAWNLLVVQHLLLAINRLIVILRARFLGSPFMLDVETEAKLFNIAHAFCWTLFVVIIALHQTSYMGALFFPGTSQFVFDNSKPYTQAVREVLWYATVVMPIICLIIYTVIIAMAIVSRISTRICDIIATNGKRPSLTNVHERRLLVQAIILYVGMVLLSIAWNSFSSCAGKICYGKVLQIIPISLTRTNHVYLIQGPALVYCGLNPILYLIMNREFRNRFQKLYGL